MTDAVITFPMLGDRFSFDPSTYFSIFGLRIHWYGLIIMTGMVLAVLYIIRRSPDFGLNEDNIYDLVLYMVPLGIVGARIYYVVFNYSLYKGDFLSVFKVWKGGLAIYGGVIFGALGVFIFSRVKKIPFGNLLDISGLGVLIGQMIGRWGNFMNREAFGSETTAPWRMGLTVPGAETIYVHPTFLYESLWNLIGFIILHFWSKKHRKYDGQLFALYLAWYGLGRFFIEGLRTDSLYLFSTGIRVSQLLAAILFIGSVIYLLINKYKIQHDPKDLYVNRKKQAEIQEQKNNDGLTEE